MRAILSKELDEAKNWVRMTTKNGINILHITPPSVTLQYIIKLLDQMMLRSMYYPLPSELGVVGRYHSLLEVVKKRFAVMISDPTICPSLFFFKDHTILVSLFANAAPESKKKVMTNTYIQFLNFLGVVSSPAMMPWINGGNFTEGSETFK